MTFSSMDFLILCHRLSAQVLTDLFVFDRIYDNTSPEIYNIPDTLRTFK